MPGRTGLGNNWDQAVQKAWQQTKSYVQDHNLDYRTASQSETIDAFSCAIKVWLHRWAQLEHEHNQCPAAHDLNTRS